MLVTCLIGKSIDFNNLVINLHGVNSNGCIIKGKNLTQAWIKALTHIIENRGECLNLMVQIVNPKRTQSLIDKKYDRIVKKYRLLNTKNVANTIFPQRLYEIVNKNRVKLYEKYNNKMYPKIKTRWGTYFKRMIDWPFVEKETEINQLEFIISRLIDRKRIYRHAYTILICSPERNFGQPVGAPCLNYLTLQIDSKDKRISMLAVYRNQDFIRRAYGNYIGLSNLQSFICEQSKFKVGCLTILSSHAYISSSPSRKELEKFIKEIK